MKPLLTVQNLKKFFPVYGGLFSTPVGQVKAVNDVSFEIRKGETLGLVGESGCGKTTVGRMTIRLLEPTFGNVVFDQIDLRSLSERQLAPLRTRMQIIFQDPYSSLNPRFTVEHIIGEAMLIHKKATHQDVKEKISTLLERVGLSPKYMKRYPHEFSGGQRQRIGIARALALNPEYIVCDEPVSALDASIQAQIINLLQTLQEHYNLSLLFISHDLNVVKHLSQRTAVMYLGRLVEIAPTGKLNYESAHPYTQALLSSNPQTDPKKSREHPILKGDVPSPMDPPSGCHFHPRCPQVMDHCRTITPKTITLGKDHTVQCHLYDSTF
ncbi:MAG: ABC transporter ATP-binding protein [Nitrospinota bacterium]|nr:ABC transporter ATP-binding protein [Nitrospinota bacterium]